jgi:hypothetical protein
MVDTWVVWALGLAIIIVIVATNRPPDLLVKVRDRYERLMQTLHDDPNLDPRWEPVKKPVILTGMCGWDKSKGAIAYNVNKGYEIYLCLEGGETSDETRINTAMHVLIHELSHSTVREYEHSDAFWKNFKDFRKYCAQRGLYTPGDVGPFCGENIKG